MAKSPVHGTSGDDARPPEPRAAELDSHFRSSFRVLWLIAVGIVGDAALAEDVVQEAAVIALNKLDQYQPGSNFAAWIGQIVRNVAFNRARERRRRIGGTVSLAAESPANLLRESPPSMIEAQADSSGVEAQDLTRLVMQALDGVAEIPRACLLLRTVEGLSYGQISALLEIPEGTAMSHVHRTRQTIRRSLLTAWSPGAPGKELDGNA